MGSTSTDPSLADRLADALPAQAGFKFYHISTPPKRSPALFSAPPGAKPEKTYTESHFLNVSVRHGGEEVFIFAIEVLIYTTRRLTTIFVSKADSTGYLALLKLGKGHSSPLRTIATSFLGYLVEKRQRKGIRLVLSLFARANSQYLFPGSVENKAKHVSDDRELVRWWCRVLDPVLAKYKARGQEGERSAAQSDTTSQAYLIVPGEDTIVPYLPPHVRLDPARRARWTHGHPLLEIAKHPSAPPRCLVPHFPDDPKARFLDELDDELPDSSTPSSQLQASPSKRGNGHWRSVRSLEQFWEMMAFRQECSSGRLVGFIWVVFTPPEAEKAASQDAHGSAPGSACEQDPQSTPTSPSPSSKRKSSPHHARGRPMPRRRKKALKGPIIPRTPKIKSASVALASKSVPEESEYFIWPPSSRGEIVLAEKDYKKAAERLLALQFRNEETAVASTKTWVDEVAVLAHRGERWGQDVVGRKEPESPGVVQTTSSAVNTLGVKRKADAVAEAPEPSNGVNTLGSGLVKKKKKVQPQQA
ncbi:uncharacterized protein PV09_02023 [Verruconis gallopava]|uniref:histone acetyltransferase n=1 Tax=Verruconis gallopava TaxID=253628 RepID=A0A0D2B7C9_9PEZI|nr:uncharacterized protein PV09_02023 [Verruconis gallopava]KIW07154.1 hypothetical protein PV09_02023 [Verruconis gallopava]